MRFYKTNEKLRFFQYATDFVEKGKVVCISKYFRSIVVISDGDSKTKFVYGIYNDALNLILDGKLTPLTEKEVNKIRPHLRKEHFGVDLYKDKFTKIIKT